MTLQVAHGPAHDCATDGHRIALRDATSPDLDGLRLVPFCEACRLVLLPGGVFTHAEHRDLIRLVGRARRAKA